MKTVDCPAKRVTGYIGGLGNNILVFGFCLLGACLTPVSLVAQSTNEFTVQTNATVVMRDGAKLSANLFLPKSETPCPVLLMRTPYGKGDAQMGQAKFYASRGYAVLSQDCRGKGQSEGEWDPFMNEGDDGRDTLKWIVSQPWCNGKIGTMGGSYVGFTQWIMAPGAGPQLKAMFPTVPMSDAYEDAIYFHGAFNLSLAFGWGTLTSFKPGETMPSIKWDQAWRELPLSTWDKKITGRTVPYLRKWIANPEYNAYWDKASNRNRWKEINVPVFAVGGWYDIFSKPILEQWQATYRAASGKSTRAAHCVLIGPWPHGISRKVGELDFGASSLVNLQNLESQWFDYWLKDKTNGVAWSPLRIFVMGINQWRDEKEWPLARTQYENYYFHSQGSANSLEGNGTLSPIKPNSEKSDNYIYDPLDPVPTLGGCNLFGCPIGPHDQRQAEKRADVLVYTSSALKEAMEVTGPVKVVLHAASDAPDTDWTAKLVDVCPDGKAINLCDGILRARYREFNAKSSLLEKGKTYRYEIDLWVTSNVFLPEHRIRVEISSSNFPRFDRNPNTGHLFGMDAELQSAQQTVYHDETRPSHIVLPVIPNNFSK